MIEALGAAIRRSLLLGLFEHSIDKFPCLIWYATGVRFMCLPHFPGRDSILLASDPALALSRDSGFIALHQICAKSDCSDY